MAVYRECCVIHMYLCIALCTRTSLQIPVFTFTTVAGTYTLLLAVLTHVIYNDKYQVLIHGY